MFIWYENGHRGNQTVSWSEGTTSRGSSSEMHGKGIAEWIIGEITTIDTENLVYHNLCHIIILIPLKRKMLTQRMSTGPNLNPDLLGSLVKFTPVRLLGRQDVFSHKPRQHTGKNTFHEQLVGSSEMSLQVDGMTGILSFSEFRGQERYSMRRAPFCSPGRN